MCMFYEKLNMQKSVIMKANMKLASREEELKFFKSEVHHVAVSMHNLGLSPK